MEITSGDFFRAPIPSKSHIYHWIRFFFLNYFKKYAKNIYAKLKNCLTHFSFYDKLILLVKGV